MAEAIPFTKEGFAQLSEELHRLKSHDRPKIIQDIADARSHGDLSENAEYAAARERQGWIEARIADLDDKLSRAKVINYEDEGGTPQQVRFGAWVTVSDEASGEEKTYRIVGDLESDIAKNKISLSSPIAKALLGKRVDDNIEVHAPKGSISYVITDLRYE